MAALSDEQVRRLLIEALKKQAAEEATAATDKKEITGIAGFIDAVRAKVDLIRLRVEALKSGDDTKMTQIPSLYTYLGKGERDTNSTRVILSAIAVFLAAFFIDFLFNRYTAAVRRRSRGHPARGLEDKRCRRPRSARAARSGLHLCVARGRRSGYLLSLPEPYDAPARARGHLPGGPS